MKKNRVGRSVKKLFFLFLFCSKKCVLCILYVDWELEGQKKLKGRASSLVKTC